MTSMRRKWFNVVLTSLWPEVQFVDQLLIPMLASIATNLTILTLESPCTKAILVGFISVATALQSALLYSTKFVSHHLRSVATRLSPLWVLGQHLAFLWCLTALEVKLSSKRPSSACRRSHPSLTDGSNKDQFFVSSFISPIFYPLTLLWLLSLCTTGITTISRPFQYPYRLL